MCGISGIFGPGCERGRLSAMVAAQRHRGPDAEGFFMDPSGAAGLGHNRLSIIDLSPSGRQPMSNAEGSVWIAFNGEVYNYRELRGELHDYPYRSRTDTEVVLAAYERDSPRAGEADLIVAKHRNGPTRTVTVAFHGHFSRFADMVQV